MIAHKSKSFKELMKEARVVSLEPQEKVFIKQNLLSFISKNPDKLQTSPIIKFSKKKLSEANRYISRPISALIFGFSGVKKYVTQWYSNRG